MKIVEAYFDKFKYSTPINSDFHLFEVDFGILVGVDKNGNTVLVLKSYQPSKSTVMQKSKMISVECNVRITYRKEEKIVEDIAHIIRCFAIDPKEREIFLELGGLFIGALKTDEQEEFILELFSVLTAFFANKIELSERELRGLYTELYTIKSYEENLHLSKYWQSRDKMKFDFSITQKVKLEIKSTIKSERRHHFKHDQLVCLVNEIFVLSYMLRSDDQGLSLYDLIIDCKKLLSAEPQKVLRLIKVQKDISEQFLREMKFDETYMLLKRKFYNVFDIPRFNELTPDGVANAEYDCLLDNIKSISEKDMLLYLSSVLLDAE